jgi:hypothetical protein
MKNGSLQRIGARTILPLLEQPLNMRSQIYTEADYLQAHLTVIVKASRRSYPAFHDFTLRVTAILKKWIAAAMEARAPV